MSIEVLVAARQQGKTTALIKLAAEGYFYIVCIDRREQQRVFDLAKGMDLSIPFPITWEDFLGKRYNAEGIRGFLFDNLDVMLERMAGGVPIHAATFTK